MTKLFENVPSKQRNEMVAAFVKADEDRNGTIDKLEFLKTISDNAKKLASGANVDVLDGNLKALNNPIYSMGLELRTKELIDEINSILQEPEFHILRCRQEKN